MISCMWLINPTIAIGGGVIYPPKTDLFNGISEPLGIEWSGLVTFPSNGWATKRYENYCPVLHRKSNMSATIPGYVIEISPKSGPFTKPCTNFTRLHILMRFSTVLVIRHSIVTFLSTHDDETSPIIQDGSRQTGRNPHCITVVMFNFT